MEIINRTIKSKSWWLAAGTRALRTFGQTASGFLGVGLAISDIDWLTMLSVSSVASLLSLFMSLGGLPEVELAEG